MIQTPKTIEDFTRVNSHDNYRLPKFNESIRDTVWIKNDLFGSGAEEAKQVVKKPREAPHEARVINIFLRVQTIPTRAASAGGKSTLNSGNQHTVCNQHETFRWCKTAKGNQNAHPLQ